MLFLYLVLWQKSYPFTPLMIASWNAHVDAVDELLTAGAQVDYATKEVYIVYVFLFAYVRE